MPKSRHGVWAFAIVAGMALCAAAMTGAPSPPDNGEMQSALSCFQSGDYVQAESLASSLASRAYRPNFRAWVIAGDARQQLHQYAAAVRAYRLFLASCDSVETRTYISRQLQQCQAAMQTSLPPVPPSKKLSADDKKALSEVSGQTVTESSEHFIVHARNPVLAKLMTVEAENALLRICRVILPGKEYAHMVEINVWANHDDYLLHCTDAAEWSGGNFTFSSRGGEVVRRIDLAQCDRDGLFADIMLDRILPHEMCHLVLQERFGDAACPLFLNEGLAMMAEAEVDNTRVVLAGTALAGKGKIALDDLLVRQRADNMDMPVFYAESFSLVSFLHRNMSREQLAAFLEHVKGGCTVTDALLRAYYIPYDEEFGAKLAGAWEDYAITQGQYVQALRQSLSRN